MNATAAHPEVQQFILDCADLASSLDSLDIRENRHDMPEAVQSGNARYSSLLTRRKALWATASEQVWLDFALEGLRARLKFLERRTGNVRPLASPGGPSFSVPDRTPRAS
jgi:hypothetical protein